MTLGLSVSAFSPVPFQDALIIKAQAEISKLTEAVAYLWDAINYPHLTSKKVHSTVNNLARPEKLARPENAFVYLATDDQDLRTINGSSLLFLKMLVNSPNSPVETSSLMTRYEVKADYTYRKDPDRRIPKHLAM